MIPTLPKRLALVFICLGLIATAVRAQTQEQLQEQLVDSMNRTGQEIDRAKDKLKANDTTGACAELRAASVDNARTIDLAEQLAAILKTDTSLSDLTRARMRLDLVDILTNFTLQKRGLEAQISAKCN